MSEQHLPPKQLDERILLHGVAYLCARDADLARVVDEFGPPPLWARPPGFATLLHIILEQQVSLASAHAAFRKLGERVRPLTPGNFLALDDATLREVGFSRQKARYGRLLARAVLDGSLDLEALAELDDDEVRRRLKSIKGIGDWTANIYMMEALLRPDVWPSGDLALANAARRVKGLARRPSPVQLEELGQRYRPWRAVAARIFWHHYLSAG
ncbi:MAG: DNA-3-methyladenine glycosylase 2 family protein [Caldilineae bacterium]|nr:MAG: DNA-3-methyladenine glycosylase 2 family protein [Caldilineae bacterium]